MFWHTRCLVAGSIFLLSMTQPIFLSAQIICPYMQRQGTGIFINDRLAHANLASGPNTVNSQLVTKSRKDGSTQLEVVVVTVGRESATRQAGLIESNGGL